MPGLLQHKDFLRTLCALQDLSFGSLETKLKGIRSLQMYQQTLYMKTRDGTAVIVGQESSIRADERIRTLLHLRAQDTADRRRRYEEFGDASLALSFSCKAWGTKPGGLMLSQGIWYDMPLHGLNVGPF